MYKKFLNDFQYLNWEQLIRPQNYTLNHLLSEDSILNDIKRNIIINQNFLEAINANLDDVCSLTNANGFVLISNDHIFSYGDIADLNVISQIRFDATNFQESIFKSKIFDLKLNLDVHFLFSFLDHDQSCFLIWFKNNNENVNSVWSENDLKEAKTFIELIQDTLQIQDEKNQKLFDLLKELNPELESNFNFLRLNSSLINNRNLKEYNLEENNYSLENNLLRLTTNRKDFWLLESIEVNDIIIDLNKENDLNFNLISSTNLIVDNLFVNQLFQIIINEAPKVIDLKIEVNEEETIFMFSNLFLENKISENALIEINSSQAFKDNRINLSVEDSDALNTKILVQFR